MNNYSVFFNKLNYVYEGLEDQRSKEIFLERVKISMIRDKYQIGALINLADRSIYESYYWLKEKIDSMITENNGLILIYGAGNDGDTLLYYLNNFYPQSNIIFCDKNYDILDGKKSFSVISPNELLEKYLDYKIFVATSQYELEVKEFLLSNGWKRDNIFLPQLNRLIDKEQYFDNDIIELSDNEVFLDAGAFDGETALEFAKRCNNEYAKIFAFEPDSGNYEKVVKNLEHQRNCYCYKNGLWNIKDSLFFYEDNNMVSRVSKEKTINKIDVDTIDNLLLNENITFIKMDIEGAEQKAIEGAKNVIMKCKPKLAICVYHDYSVILEVYEYLKNLVPEYRFYLRQHAASLAETVLYAVL